MAGGWELGQIGLSVESVVSHIVLTVDRSWCCVVWGFVDNSRLCAQCPTAGPKELFGLLAGRFSLAPVCIMGPACLVASLLQSVTWGAQVLYRRERAEGLTAIRHSPAAGHCAGERTLWELRDLSDNGLYTACPTQQQTVSKAVLEAKPTAASISTVLARSIPQRAGPPIPHPPQPGISAA